MYKILVVFTGGTIGCAPLKNGSKDFERNINDSIEKTWKDYYLLTNYVQNHPKEINDQNLLFETMEPMQIKSENMTIGQWNKLISALKAIDFTQYDGVIITHGTDTLAYTASLLGVLLYHVTIPVILVSSNEPLQSLAPANGHKNFEDAVSFICNEYGINRGTYVAYSYDLRSTTFYLATQIKQSQAFIDKFDSRTGVDFGYMDQDVFYLNNIDESRMLHANPVDEIEELMEDSGYPGKTILDVIKELDNCVLMITPYVGLNYSCLKLLNYYKAVLHDTYHSFTFCLESDEYPLSVKYLSEECHKNNIALYFSPYRSNEYASLEEIEQLGAKFIMNSSLELSYAKLLVAYSIFHSEEDIDRFLNISLDTIY